MKIISNKQITPINPHSNDNDMLNNLLSMRMKTGVCKTFALVFTKEPAVTQNYVIDFVSRTFSIQTMPFFRRLLTFPMSQNEANNQFDVKIIIYIGSGEKECKRENM